jgi:polyhydroxybutyrate depolymerase
MGGYDCRPSQPVSILHIHGDADKNHPIDGGNGENSLSVVDFNSAYDTVDQWVALDGCDPDPTEATEGDDPANPYDESTWACPEGASVVLDVIPGGPHSWPGGTTVIPERTGKPSTAMDATRRIWTFLDAHGR